LAVHGLEVVVTVETSFGRWLQRRRKALDLTQEELAQRVSCAAETLRKIEADARRPSRQIAERLAEALEIPETDRPAFIKAARAELAVDRLAHPTQDIPQVVFVPAKGLSSETVPPLFAQITSTFQTKSSPSSNKSTTNLPAPLTTFIGREKEQSDVIDLITKHRLVTLTGAGGVGKTRLALKVASAMLKQFPDGVWFLDLAPLSDTDMVPSTLARLLGLREGRELAVTNLVTEYLYPRTVLVLFDNCEHLIEVSTRFVHSLLTSCPQLAILATSREALRVSGEIHYHLPPLVIPTLHTDLTMDEIAKIDSVKLFNERAEAASPGFVINERNALVIAHICRHLDGIPLAIELAAAHANVLTVEQILKRLDNRFNLLTRGARTVLPRQQTLLATIEWSYDLLTDSERSLLRRLAVFAGGFTLEAAEAICGRQGLILADILNILERLVDKSLVNVEQVISTGDPRYRLLETIREYLLVRLQESNETLELRDAHLKYFTEFVQEVGPKLFTREQTLWFARIEVEMDNLRAALDWSMTDIVQNPFEFPDNSAHPSKRRQLFELCKHLGEVLNAQANYNEAVDVYKLMLKRAEDLGDIEAQSRALQGIAYSMGEKGDNLSSLDYAMKAETSAQRGNARIELTLALWTQGIARYRLGEPRAALSLGEQALKIATELNDSAEMGRCLNLLGGAHYALGQYAQAESYWENALKTFEELGNKQQGMVLLNNLSAIADVRGDHHTAYQRYDRALQIAREIGNRDREILFLTNRGGTQVALGKYEAAMADLQLAIQLAGNTGSWCLPITFNDYAEALIGLDRYDEALYSAEQALFLAEKDGTPEYMGMAWRTLGKTCEKLGKPIRLNHLLDGVTRKVMEYDARTCFHKSEVIFTEAELDVERAHTLKAWARYELSLGNKENGVAMWYEARKIFEEVGARWEIERMATMPA
jgi:predicted ATPase/transcriptional regulator with XRE-family HTH domain